MYPHLILTPQGSSPKKWIPGHPTFHPGCRYAAIPGKSVNNQNVEVDLHDVRPYLIIYYDHVLHLADLGHNTYMKLGQTPFQVSEKIQY